MAEAKTEKMNGSCKELFEKIVNRQIAALMFHDKMADLYDFLAYTGSKGCMNINICLRALHSEG